MSELQSPHFPFRSLILPALLPLLPDRQAMWRALCVLPLGWRAVMVSLLALMHAAVPLGALWLFAQPWWMWGAALLMWPLHWVLTLVWGDSCLSLADRHALRRR